MLMLTPEQIRQLREALGWKQYEMAYHLKVSENCIKQWESGRRHPNYKRMGQLNELLKKAQGEHGLVLAQ